MKNVKIPFLRNYKINLFYFYFININVGNGREDNVGAGNDPRRLYTLNLFFSNRIDFYSS